MTQNSGLGGSVPLGGGQKKNRFEQVDELQPDAITLSLEKRDGEPKMLVRCPATASGGKLPKDYSSGFLPAKDAFRGAIKLANDLRLPIVVIDRDGLWQKEWGDLVRIEDEG